MASIRLSIAVIISLGLLSACSGSSDEPANVVISVDNSDLGNTPSSPGNGEEVEPIESVEPAEPIGPVDPDNSGSPMDSTETSTALSPLPNPPLTQGPSEDDEPVPQDARLNTITSFQVLREANSRVPVVKVEQLTEEDFAEGIPDPVITLPEGVDPDENGAPFFEGLQNVRVAAGDVLEILYAPQDPEGELPGLFSQGIPEGATFTDNFDGTRTFRWQPLQSDIGITDLTIVAVDPAVPAYRSSQTVLIAVDEPTDPSAVPNVAPVVQTINNNYTIRVGDPAVVFIYGFDRNNTTPTVELVNPPAGVSLIPDDRDPEIQWIRYVPDTVGTVLIDVLVRDEIDASLTGTEQITLNVRPAADFEREGERLRDAAIAGGNVRFGSAISPVFYLQGDGGLYESFFSSEFSVMTPESSMKWDAINPFPGSFTFGDMDTLMLFAQMNGMSVRGHPLVWHSSLPAWIEQTAVEDREIHMREFISRVMNRYGDRVEFWDVVNEPMDDAGGELRESIWYEAMGESYIDTAFRQARELEPDAVLVLNEFDIGFAGPKFDGFLELVDRLLEREVPIDAIGFQMHLFSSFDQFDEFAANIATMAERDLDIHITELDVSIAEGSSEAIQADVYAQVIEACKAQPRCTVLQTWGFTDRYSFRRQFNPLYLDQNHNVKPAYTAIQEALASD